MLYDGVHCAWYTDLESCTNRCLHFIANAPERQTIRSQGEQFVRANHTYDQRIPFILEDRKWVNPL
jgi:spore maturation protein CgeB